MKSLLISFLFFFYIIAGPTVIAQCPDEDILITTQGQLDSFKIVYPDCDSLDAKLEIWDLALYNIEDLSGLSNLVYIRELSVNSSWALKNLSGLENLKKVEKLLIFRCIALESVEAIQGLSIGNTLRLEILDNLKETVEFVVSDSMQWISINNSGQFPFYLNEISNLNYVELLSLGGKLAGPGLTELKKVDKVRVYGPINGIKSMNDIYRLIPNTDLVIEELLVSGVDTFSTSGIGTWLKINLLRIGGLKHLDFTGIGELKNTLGELDVADCNIINSELLKDLQVEKLSFNRINDMDSLPALKSGTSIKRINLINMENLVDISAVDEYSSIESVWFRNNPKLDVCHYETVCRVLKVDSLFASIQNNAPGCASLEEVEAQCVTSTSRHSNFPDVQIAPNPVGDNLQIVNLNAANSSWTYDVYRINGQFVQSGPLRDNSIDVSTLQSGMYILVLRHNEQIIPVKFVR